LRERAGTGNAASTHAYGEAFVLLDPSRIFPMPINLSDIGSTLSFETFLLNLFGSTPSTPQKMVPTNAHVKPLAPHILRAWNGSAASSLDITVTWIRRARVSYGWLSGADVALDESAEAYTLNVYKGAALLRSQTINGPFVAPVVPSFTRRP
jgi:hypothetical protein